MPEGGGVLFSLQVTQYLLSLSVSCLYVSAYIVVALNVLCVCGHVRAFESFPFTRRQRSTSVGHCIAFHSLLHMNFLLSSRYYYLNVCHLFLGNYCCFSPKELDAFVMWQLCGSMHLICRYFCLGPISLAAAAENTLCFFMFRPTFLEFGAYFFIVSLH